MLTTVAILLACVTGIASDYTTARQSTTEAYGQKTTNDYGLKDNIQQQIKRLSELVDAAYEDDEAFVDRLFDSVEKRKLNTQLTDIFLTENFPQIRQRQANQSDEIAELEQKVETLTLLTDDVTVINSSLAEISRQARLLANESEDIEREANDAATDNYQQEKRLAALRARLAEQESKFDELENVTSEFRDILRSKLALIENITGVIDREQADVVVVVLTRENPTAIRSLEDDFTKSRPQVLFGISFIHIADESQSYVLPDNYGGKSYGDKSYGDKSYGDKSYGGKSYGGKSGNASIDFNVDVTYDSKTNEATYSLIDSSTAGWYIVEVTVSATFVAINNVKFEIEDDVTQPTTTAY
ncbi:hypothetical protein BsWGS_26649 [Bradybaena similaris]